MEVLNLRKLSKFLALFLVFVSIAAMFTGCSSEEVKLLEAMVKSQSINSMEAKVDLSIQLDVSGLSEEDMQKSGALVNVLNNMNITLNEKMVRDANTGSTKAEILSNYTVGGLTSYANIWMESGMSNGQPSVKEIFQLPPFATMAFTNGKPGKDYLVLDTASLSGLAPSTANVLDYSKFTNLNKDLVEKTSQFYLAYAKNLKPGFEIVKFKGSNGANGKAQQSYQLKISDSALKDLISFLVNDYGTNKENQQLIKDYYTSIMKLTMTLDPEAKVSQEELDKSFAEFEEQIPNFIEEFNKSMTTLKDVTILGKDGITIDYVVDNNGYIVEQNGKIDISLDLAKLSEAISQISNQPMTQESSGKINLKINTKTVISKINENVDFSLPVITEDNSIDYVSLMKNSIGTRNVNKNYKTLNNSKVSRISVFVNGKMVNFKDAPVVKGDRTLVPAREVLESLGGNLEWDVPSQTVTAKIGTNVVVFTIGSSEATVNGETRQLEAPATLINNRAYVPLRFLSDSVGGKLTWLEEASTAFIDIK